MGEAATDVGVTPSVLATEDEAREREDVKVESDADTVRAATNAAVVSVGVGEEEDERAEMNEAAANVELCKEIGELSAVPIDDSLALLTDSRGDMVEESILKVEGESGRRVGGWGLGGMLKIGNNETYYSHFLRTLQGANVKMMDIETPFESHEKN